MQEVYKGCALLGNVTYSYGYSARFNVHDPGDRASIVMYEYTWLS